MKDTNEPQIGDRGRSAKYPRQEVELTETGWVTCCYICREPILRGVRHTGAGICHAHCADYMDAQSDHGHDAMKDARY